MKKTLSLFLLSLTSYIFSGLSFAAEITRSDIGFTGSPYPEGTIVTQGELSIIAVLSFIQGVLLKLVLPVVVIGGSLYIAYELFTADGDETKMKKAWKGLTFTAVGLVCIAVSYAFVTIVSSLSL